MKFPTERILRIAIAFIAAIGIGVATYIFIADSTARRADLPRRRRGCETVAKSSYSHIAGINVAIFGIIGWILILASVFFGNDAARLGGFAVALGGFGFSIYLTYLEIWKIEAICQWCVANAVADDDRLHPQHDAAARLRRHRRSGRRCRAAPRDRSPKTAEDRANYSRRLRAASISHVNDTEDR